MPPEIVAVAGYGLATVLFDGSGSRYFSLTTQDANVTCSQHTDDDHDRCANTKETALGLDPFDPWDFYSVPAQTIGTRIAPT